MKSCLNDGCRRVTRINVSPRVLKLTRSEFLNQNYRSLYGVLSVGRFCSHSIKCVAVTTRYISVVYTQQQRESVLNCTVKSKYTHTHGRARVHTLYKLRQRVWLQFLCFHFISFAQMSDSFDLSACICWLLSIANFAAIELWSNDVRIAYAIQMNKNSLAFCRLM